VCCGNLRHAIHDVLLACGLTGLREQSSRISHISLGKFQAGEKHLTSNESVSVFYLPR